MRLPLYLHVPYELALHYAAPSGKRPVVVPCTLRIDMELDPVTTLLRDPNYVQHEIDACKEGLAALRELVHDQLHRQGYDGKGPVDTIAFDLSPYQRKRRGLGPDPQAHYTR